VLIDKNARSASPKDKVSDLELDYFPHVREVVWTLVETYGRPTLGNKRNPLDELLFIVLSSKTPPDRYQLTFRALKARYPKFERLATAKVKVVARTIVVGGLSEKKARQIVSIARHLKQTFGRVTLSPLAKMNDEEAEAFLDNLPGVGKKVARCILMYSLNRRVFPVDAHCFRISQRLGWVASEVNLTDLVADELQAGIRPELRRDMHVGMILLGREYCTPREPRCEFCPLLVWCPTGNSRVPPKAKKVLNCFDPADLTRDLLDRKSGLPASSAAEVLSATHLVLAHITSSNLLPAITQQGVLPHRGEGRAIGDNLPSTPDCVYLSSTLDHFYFERATKRFGGVGAVVVVEVNRERIEPDENALTDRDRENWSPEQQLFQSLKFGSCRHKGAIPPSQFRGIYLERGKPYEPFKGETGFDNDDP
jgi:endonuclease III